MKTILKTTMIFALVAIANTLMAAGTRSVEIRPLSATNEVFSISNSSETKRPSKINRKEVKVENEKTVVKPFFSYKSGLLRFSYLNYQKENVTFTIYENRTLIFSRRIGRMFSINEAFKLSKLDNGYYTVVLSAGDNEYNYNVQVSN